MWWSRTAPILWFYLQVSNQQLPFQLFRRRLAAILAAGFCNVTTTTKGLETAQAVRVLSGRKVQGPDVIALQASGRAAQDAPIVVTLEDGDADRSPSVASEICVASAHPASA